MPRLIKTRCCFCHRQFHKDKRHLKWNEKLGHNSYCSKECESSYRRTGKWLICDNKNCKQKFYRILSGISRFNYCTGSCAAVVNNKKYPKWPVKYCKKCKNPFRREGSPYCSMACGKLGRFKYSKDEIIEFLSRVLIGLVVLVICGIVFFELRGMAPQSKMVDPNPQLLNVDAVVQKDLAQSEKDLDYQKQILAKTVRSFFVYFSRSPSF